ncbi:MAG: DinB family protein [Planctomycetota bacterium]
MSSCKVAAAADAILDQCQRFIRATPADCYAKPCDTVGGGTVGKHARHVLDHFQCALATASCDPIDYDHRVRGGTVETDPDAACDQIASLREQLRALTDEALHETVTTRVMLTGDGACEDLKSTRGREVFFATHHAIHHHAMMKTIGNELGIDIPDGFGMAPSTLNFETAR